MNEPTSRSPPRDAGVFLTGATGFLGRHLLADLLRNGEHVTVLVRASDRDAARRRVSEVMASTAGGVTPSLDAQVSVCLGALDQPRLGMSGEDHERVIAECGAFLHCGASVRFDLTLEAARAVNVAGTRALLDLAGLRERRHGLQRFDFVGTAFVAGDRDGVVLEEELDPSVRHRNTYERSKLEAEQLVRAAAADLPAAVYRPSIVTPAAGDIARSAVDWPTRVYASGLWRTCPGRPTTPVDLVPASFVCDAIRVLRATPASIGRTFHLTAGVEGAITLGEAAAMLQRLVRGRKPVRFVEPGRWMRYLHPMLRLVPGSTGRVVRTGEYFVPYFLNNPRFDNRGTRALLAGTGVDVPVSRDVLEGLLAGAHHRAPVEDP